MNKRTLKKIKEKLLQDKQNIEDELSTIANKSSNKKGDYEAKFPDYGNEDGENATEVADFNDNVALEKNLEKILRDIKNTLKLVEKGEYGKCKYCNKKIDAQRLLVRPASSACVRCKEKLTGVI